MIQRVAILAASLVAAAGLAVGLVFAGIVPAAANVAAEPVSAPVLASTDAPQPVVQVDTVYVAPQATPEDIVVIKTVSAHPKGDDGENEGSDD
jgi:hypothetical protein